MIIKRLMVIEENFSGKILTPHSMLRLISTPPTIKEPCLLVVLTPIVNKRDKYTMCPAFDKWKDKKEKKKRREDT